MSEKSAAEEAFAEAWKAIEPPGADTVREFRFHPTRRWRLDFAWPSLKIGLEIHGRGRHQTVVGSRADAEKNNEAIRLGWRILSVIAPDKKHADEWAAMVLDVMTSEHLRSEDA